MKEKKKRFGWLKILIICFVLILSICLYTRYIGPFGLKVHEKNIIDNKIPKSFYGFKIAHISDLHYNNTTTKKELKKLVNKVNQTKPDIIVFTGDLLDNKIIYTDQDSKDLVTALNNLNSQYKYIITGDHDNNDIYMNIINKTDFKLLDNTYEILYNNDYESILIGGISTKSDKKNIAEKISTIDAAILNNNPNYNILLIHEPSLIKDLNYSDYQLVLAGHTHNGQINIPGLKQFFIAGKEKKYSHTYYRLDKTNMYISSGIGTTNFKGRLLNKPSFNLYRLLNK